MSALLAAAFALGTPVSPAPDAFGYAPRDYARVLGAYIDGAELATHVLEKGKPLLVTVPDDEIR